MSRTLKVSEGLRDVALRYLAAYCLANDARPHRSLRYESRVQAGVYTRINNRIVDAMAERLRARGINVKAPLMNRLRGQRSLADSEPWPGISFLPAQEDIADVAILESAFVKALKADPKVHSLVKKQLLLYPCDKAVEILFCAETLGVQSGIASASSSPALVLLPPL